MMVRSTNPLLLALLLASAAAHSAEPARPAQPTLDKIPGRTQADSTQAKATVPSPKSNPDRLDLDVSVVTGNRELPKVLYIVPWKKAELGDLPEQPFNSLLDEALKPVDRDEFRREVAYFSKLTERPTAADAGSEEKSPIAPTTPR
ncbi:MAG: hypothetical protein ABL964_11655 [Steroidobacteraceae bacterium]